MAVDPIPTHTPRPRVGRFASLAAVFALLLTSFALTTPAGAEESFTFTGGGWGHGVGMSQYGACGMAQAGKKYTQILTHYYSGTKISAVTEPGNLRVLLADASSYTIDVPTGSTISGVGTVSARTITVKRVGNTAKLTGGITKTISLPLTINQNGPMKISPPGQRFDRGHLVIRAGASSTTLHAVIEGLSTRDYLLGLGEMSASWPIEALRSQATAARTIAVVKKAHPGGADHDLKGYNDGAYIGYEMQAHSGKYWSNWESAIATTAGKVITYAGSPIPSAVYSSSTGGRTENNEIVWGKGNSASAVPYLRGVADPSDSGCNNPRYKWTKSFTASQLGAKLSSPAIRSIKVSGIVGPSGRTDAATITFTDVNGGHHSFNGAQLRWKLGLYSTKFTIGGAVTAGASAKPSGSIIDIRAHQGRNILVAGRATDPDGTPKMFVADRVNGRTKWYVFNSANGYFMAAFPAAAGTHTTCVAVLDTPTGAATTLGCRNTVIK